MTSPPAPETVSKRRRRRWPWIVLTALLLFAGPPIAWRYRPLNATERRLVGTWILPDTRECYVFTADRRFQYSWRGEPRSAKLEGSWRCSADRFHMHSDLGHLVDSRDPGIGNWIRRTYRSLVDSPDGVGIRFEGSTVDFRQGVYVRADLERLK